MSDYQNQNQQKNFEPQYFSRIRLSDQDTNTSLTFRYWKGLLVFRVDAVTPQSNGGVEFTELNSAYFSPFKAQVFAAAIGEFMTDKKHMPIGINLGSGEKQTCVTFIHDEKNDKMTIFNISPTGEKEKEVSMFFSNDYNYYLEFKDVSKIDYKKVYHNGLELEMIKGMLEQFSAAMYGGYAYAVMDYQRFHNTRTDNNFNKIMDKLGIQRENGGGGYNSNRGSSRDSFFNRQSDEPKSTASTARDIDELDDLI